MPNVPTASERIAPITDAARGAFHQKVLAPAPPREVPSYFSPVPVGQILQSGIVETAYSETITAQGGTSPYSFAITSGSLPSGLVLNGSTGVIAGTPTAPATNTFTIQVTDGNGITGSQQFSIIIAATASSAANYCLVN